MKIPIIDLTLDNLLKLKTENDWSDHFNLVVWPRVLFWLGMKEQFNEYESLDWKIHFTPNNMHNNFLSMHIIDPNQVFNFYFQVPLVEKLSLNLYLGDNTYNFFEIHPFLVAKGVVKQDEPEIKATSSILPHLLLSSENSRYEKKTLWDINTDNYLEIVKTDPIINLLVQRFKHYVPPLKKIVSSEWTL